MSQITVKNTKISFSNRYCPLSVCVCLLGVCGCMWVCVCVNLYFLWPSCLYINDINIMPVENTSYQNVWYLSQCRK